MNIYQESQVKVSDSIVNNRVEDVRRNHNGGNLPLYDDSDISWLYDSYEF